MSELKGLEKYLDACRTLNNFCWQFRPYCKRCPFFEPGMCTMGIPKEYKIHVIRDILEDYDKRRKIPEEPSLFEKIQEEYKYNEGN